MSNEAAEKMITLRSLDGEEFVVTEEVAKMSRSIRNMIEDNCAQSTIPLPNVTAKILAKVIEYCKMHVSREEGEDLHAGSLHEKDMENWDSEFVKVDHETLFDLILAANYLDIKSLLDLTCKNVAEQMTGKTLDELREHFHITNDYTPEEEADLRKEFHWAFE